MKLTSKLEMILIKGPKDSGSLQYPEAILQFEEEMTFAELEAVEKFLNWLNQNHLVYGTGTLHARWAEWQAA